MENHSDFYLRISANLKARLDKHNAGQNRSTRGKTWRVVYYEAYHDERVARQREQKLKRNRRMNQLLMLRIKSQFE